MTDEFQRQIQTEGTADLAIFYLEKLIVSGLTTRNLLADDIQVKKPEQMYKKILWHFIANTRSTDEGEIC